MSNDVHIIGVPGGSTAFRGEERETLPKALEHGGDWKWKLVPGVLGMPL